MAGFTRENAEKLRATLHDATIKCSERCLYQAAKWTAELSDALSPHLEEPLISNNGSNPSSQNEKMSMPSIVVSANSDPNEAYLEARETHNYLLAKSYFDCHEFERCASVFLPSGLSKWTLSSLPSSTKPSDPMTSTKSVPATSFSRSKHSSKEPFPLHDRPLRLSQKALFIALYSRYMAGEKKKEEATEMVLGPADKTSVINTELVGIATMLESYFTARDPGQGSDGWLEFLYGMVLSKGKNEEDSKRWLVRSVHLFPYNWSAWLELSDLLNSTEELQNIIPELPQNIMTILFNLHANQVLFQCTEQIHRQLADLEEIFPRSQFLKTERALLFYHSRDFDEAESIFAGILRADPHRIDSLDHYSNILYVMRARPKLAFLAQLAAATDKFRPETCCVVGNYYSLKAEHEKAVQYFRRALMLDRSFLSAWTLMGHEYVEMKNTHAAIESYRRAVDVNRKDYRAWYGLGQTYEILEMHLYALFYYQRAASLRPYDSTMWNAIGSCYDKIGRPLQGIKAYKRAIVAGTYYDTSSSFSSGSTTGAAPDPWMVSETLYNIALMYEKLNNMEEAASYMEMTLAQEEGQGQEEDEDEGTLFGLGVTNTTSKARMWLAKWEYRKGGLPRAMELANELCQDGVEVEEAKALIRDLRARMEGNGD